MSPSVSASALPSALLPTSMLVIPACLRISKTGTPAARKPATWYMGRSGTELAANGMTPGECVWITLLTSGLAL